MALDELTGRRVLLVEDDYFIASEMARAFERAGAEVIGPASNLAQAQDLLRADRIDGAVLDIHLRGEMVFPVADVLHERGVPFVFATGYDPEIVPDRFEHIVRCEKPVDPRQIIEALFGPSNIGTA